VTNNLAMACLKEGRLIKRKPWRAKALPRSGDLEPTCGHLDQIAQARAPAKN